jgi:hypothetical protein
MKTPVQLRPVARYGSVNHEAVQQAGRENNTRETLEMTKTTYGGVEGGEASGVARGRFVQRGQLADFSRGRKFMSSHFVTLDMMDLHLLVTHLVVIASKDSYACEQKGLE